VLTEPSNYPGVILVGRRTQEATKDMGIDDESSHPALCSEVANGGLSARSSTLAYLDILLERAIRLPRMSTKEQNERIELLQGTLDLLILRTLRLGPAHGHAVAKAIEFNSDDVLQVEQGSLYPALHRLIKRGWISVEVGTSENNRRAKFYRLTVTGRRQLAVETSKWERLAEAIARILRPPAHEGKS
jgi:PadR family transcriptional regulator, regulatory protein PadR